MTEAVAVSPEGRISPGDLGLWADGQVGPLARIASFLAAQGAVPAIQLAHAGRKASTKRPWEGGGRALPADGGWEPVFAPSAVPFDEAWQVPEALDADGMARLAAAFAAAFVLFAWLPRPLNLLTLGSEAAATRGVDVGRAQRLAFLGASVATGAAVSLGGPIGFVGIVVPHLVRLLVGADHRVVLPASALFGAAFLVLCDLVARTALSPLELPVGVITALIGGPFFLWLLVRRK